MLRLGIKVVRDIWVLHMHGWRQTSCWIVRSGYSTTARRWSGSEECYTSWVTVAEPSFIGWSIEHFIALPILHLHIRHGCQSLLLPLTCLNELFVMALIVLDSVSAVATLHILISSSTAKHLKHSLLCPQVFTGWRQGLDLALAWMTHVLVWIVHIVSRHKLVVRRRASIVIRRALKPGMAQFIIWWQWGAHLVKHVATSRVNRCCTGLKTVGRAFLFLVILSAEATSIPVVEIFRWAEILLGWRSLTKGHSSTALIIMFLIFSLVCFSAVALFQVVGN